MLEANKIVDKMMSNDSFSQWLGIEVVSVIPGTCVLKMTVRPEMTNGFGIAHGAITYALADSALAFASNGHGQHAVSIETSISHTKAVKPGDVLVAVAEEKNRTRRTGIYHIEIKNGDEVVALFKGTVFVKETNWSI